MVSVIVVLIGVAIYLWLASTKPQPPRAEDANAAVQVPAMVVQPVTVRRQWTAYGTARALDAAEVSAEVASVVLARPDTTLAGASVDAGQILAVLDDTDFHNRAALIRSRITDIEAQIAQLDLDEQNLRAQRDLLQTEIDLAEREYERVVEAARRDAAREREVDNAQRTLIAARRAMATTDRELVRIDPQRHRLSAQRDGLRTELQLAQHDIERCEVRSPINGVIQSVDFSAGDRVGIGQRMVRVVDLDTIEIPMRLRAAARAHVAIGDDVRLTAGGDRRSPSRWQGEVARIAPEDDEASRTFEVFVEMTRGAPSAAPLAPGQFVQAAIVSNTELERYVIPRRALRGEQILVIEDDIVELRSVEIDFEIQRSFPELGIDDEFWVVLAEPLPAETVIVLDGTRNIAVGTPAKATFATRLSEGSREREAGSDGDAAGPTNGATDGARP